MVEEQVDVEGLSVDFHWHLAAYKGETPSKFQEKIAEVSQQPPFYLPFVSLPPDCWKIEVVRSLRICSARSELGGGNAP